MRGEVNKKEVEKNDKKDQNVLMGTSHSDGHVISEWEKKTKKMLKLNAISY